MGTTPAPPDCWQLCLDLNVQLREKILNPMYSACCSCRCS